MSIFDPLGVSNITAPKGQGDAAANPRGQGIVYWSESKPNEGGQRPPNEYPEWQKAYDAYQAGQGRGAASAGAAAGAAGDYAANEATRQWSPTDPNNGGKRPTDPTQAAAYDAYQAGQLRSSAASGAAAGAAGDYAAQHNNTTVMRQGAADTAGLDFLKPGANETFYAQHGNDLSGPSDAQSFYSQHAGDLNNPGTGERFAQDQISKFSPIAPANMDPYYDRAVELSTRKINSELAARGTYGSSVGLGQIGTAVTDLRAQQARDQAKYGLDLGALENTRVGTLGGLANNADQNAISRWLAGEKGAEGSADDALARWKATQEGAQSAQGSQRTRGQDLYNNTMGVGESQGNVVGKNLDAASATDADLMDAIISLGLGKSAQDVNSALERSRSDQAFKDQLIQAYNLYRAGAGTSSKTTTTGPAGTSTSTTTTGAN